MVITSLSILVTGSSNTPHLEPTSATNAFQQALILKTLACMTGEAQGQAGKACHVVCTARGDPETAGRVKLQSLLWDRNYRYNPGELSDWELVPCISWRRLSMLKLRVWCICPILGVYHEFSESRCNELFPLLTLIFKPKVLILWSIKKCEVL